MHYMFLVEVEVPCRKLEEAGIKMGARKNENFNRMKMVKNKMRKNICIEWKIIRKKRSHNKRKYIQRTAVGVDIQ